MTDYTSWHVGMRVVCAHADHKRVFGAGPHRFADYSESRPMTGRVYTIRALMAFGSDVFLYLQEITNDVHTYSFPDGVVRHLETPWHAGFFRPVQPRKTDISIFTAMLNKQPEHA